MDLPFSESFKIKMVAPIKKSTKEERLKWIKEAKYNLFNLKSEQVFIDLLTDSGTGSMSEKQWSEMLLGDEAYAGASSYYKMKNAINSILGFDYFLPTHQGRAAENVLFSVLVEAGDVVPGNSQFDTTKGHIEFRKAKAIDCTIDEAFDTELEYPFKGNADIKKLEKVFEDYDNQKIKFIIITLTNNTAGGQPASMANLKAIREFADEKGVLVIFDSARFAENAYFIKKREKGYENKTIKEIVAEMFSYADAMTMSSKKDAIVNMGGFIAMRDKKLFEKASMYNIMFEGFLTYGGMSGRDMNALAQGLDEGTEFETLDTRVRQVEYLGSQLIDYGVPVQRPIGGHAVFINAGKLFHNMPREEFPAQKLGIELYKEAGIRGVEIGAILADRDPETGKNRFGGIDFLRLAIPRRTYTNNHMDVVVAAIKNIYDRRSEIKTGVKIVKEAPIMRHFTVELEEL